MINPTYTILHNPRCRNSRETIKILQEEGIEPEIIEYLSTPPTREELDHLELVLDMPISEFVRKNEPIYKEKKPQSNEEIKQLVLDHPIVLQRPIVIKNNKQAVVSRPPETVRTLF